jgi:hypothetical protein
MRMRTMSDLPQVSYTEYFAALCTRPLPFPTYVPGTGREGQPRRQR